MGQADLTNLWMYLVDLEQRPARLEVVPHDETDLHRVFCDEQFCLEHSATDE